MPGRSPTPGGLKPFLTAGSAVLSALFVVASCGSPSSVEPVRVATFNTSLTRFGAGDLAADLSVPGDSQAMMVAEIIQRVRPDIILLNEFDFDSAAVQGFLSNYLSRGQNVTGAVEPGVAIDYRYRYFGPVNTGVASGHDLDRDGTVGTSGRGYGADAWGFGFFPGQYGMLLLSRYPIDTAAVRTFRRFRWASMPGALLPTGPEGGQWYGPEVLEEMPLSSKSHWDVPVEVAGSVLHLLVSHPTPPVFDGPEDRNGRRNHDEIRFWSDYLTPGRDSYIVDDAGMTGGLAAGNRFLIMGDLNSDPADGDGLPEAIRGLLGNPRVDTSVVPSSEGARLAARLQGGVNLDHRGDPRLDTGDFGDETGPGNLRLDYLLPSVGLSPVVGGVFWPPSGDPLELLLQASDHRLVWLDLAFTLGD